MRRVLPTSERVWMHELVHCYMWWSKIFGIQAYRGAKPHFHCIFSTNRRTWHCRFAGRWECVTATAGKLLLLQYLLLLGYGSQGTAAMQRVTCCLPPLANRTCRSRALPLQNTHCACSTRAPSRRAAPRGAGAGLPHGWAAGLGSGQERLPPFPTPALPIPCAGTALWAAPPPAELRNPPVRKRHFFSGRFFNRGVLLVEVIV